MNWELLNDALAQIDVLQAIPAWLIPTIISAIGLLFGRKGTSQPSPSTPTSDEMGLTPELQAALMRLFQGQERQIGNLDPLQQAVAQMAMKRLPTRYQQPMPWSPWTAASGGGPGGAGGGGAGGGGGPFGGGGGAGGGGRGGQGGGQKPAL